jgi:hypothetical protein
MNAVAAPAASSGKKNVYAIHRMALAAERMLLAPTPEAEIRAGLWVVAWAVAAGAKSPPRLQKRQPPGSPYMFEVPSAELLENTGRAAQATAGAGLRHRMMCLTGPVPAPAAPPGRRPRSWRFGRRAH